MKKNINQQLRITSDMKEEIQKIAQATSIKETDVLRLLINRSIVQLRADCSGDYSKLDFALRNTKYYR